jgi:hypothetical protein
MKIAEIIARLKEPVNPRLISQKKVGGKIVVIVMVILQAMQKLWL